MHELSIALSIIDIADKEAKKANAIKVAEIELEVGELAGVEYRALDFAFETAVKNTILENAIVKIHKPKGQAICNDCNTNFEINDLYSACPKCGGYFHNIIKGKELRVKSLLVDD